MEGDAVYTVAVARDFIAQHRLIGGDWGPENELHAHHYRLELRLTGPELDEHGYLVDIVAIEALLDGIVARYRDAVLNELPEFRDLNPSIERFARIIADRLADGLNGAPVRSLVVRVWENEIAWAAYERTLAGA